MKKPLAILLAATMLLMAVPAFAEGNTTDKAITFLNFNFGDTFGNIRTSEPLHSIHFKTEIMSPRNLAEALDAFARWSKVPGYMPVCFSVFIDNRTVAGHECSPTLYFVYPMENGSSVINESAATFYAGEYDFRSDNDKAIFDDLKQKLTQLYGEPHTVGKSLDGVFGQVSLSQEQQWEYDELNRRADPSYVVWVSTANNAVLVLKHYQQDGDTPYTRLDYISHDADEIFAQIEANQGDSNSTNMEGL